MEGIMDDVKLWVQKLDSKCDRVAFDLMPHNIGLLQSPTAAAMNSNAGNTFNSPNGHRSALTPQDVGSEVVTT